MLRVTLFALIFTASAAALLASRAESMGIPIQQPNLTFPEDYCKPNKEGKVPSWCAVPVKPKPKPAN